MKHPTFHLLAVLVLLPGLLTGCLDGETVILGGHDDIPITLSASADVEAPADTTFPVSASEYIQIEEFEVQLTNLSFHGAMGMMAVEESGHNEKLRPLDAGHGEEAEATGNDTGGETPHLEDSLPLVVGLEDGSFSIGTFMVSAGAINSAELEIGSTADTPAIVIGGTFVSAATAVTTETPLEIELDASASIDLESGMEMMMADAAAGNLRFKVAGLFQDLTFPEPGSTGTIHIDDATADPGKEIVHRLTESISFGLDADGDGHVDADEHHFMMPDHDE